MEMETAGSTLSPVSSTPTIPSREAQTFWTPLNIFLIVIGVTGFFSNFLPLYVIFTRRGRLTSGGRQSRDVLLAALSVVNILTVAIPLPIFVVKYDTNTSDGTSWELGRSTICEMFHLSFVWLKLASLFIITTLNYTSYLTMTSNSDERYSSISDQISDSFSCSRSNARGFYQRQRKWSIANLVIGIALVSFLIASLPYLGLGPEGPDSKFTVKGKHLCSLEQISYPKKEKEYTFMFAVLMSTSACLLLHTVHSIVNCSSCCFKSSGGNVDGGSSSQFATSVESRELCHQVNKSYARMISLLGLLFYITWVPVMVSLRGAFFRLITLYCKHVDKRLQTGAFHPKILPW